MKFEGGGGGATTFTYYRMLCCALMHHDRYTTSLGHELTKLITYHT